MSKSRSIAVSSFLSHEVIVRKIYLIRGEKIMLDRDLAALYQVQTRVLNQAVRRNMVLFQHHKRERIDHSLRVTASVAKSDTASPQAQASSQSQPTSQSR